jgi:membrane protease YdiL (CAAX protease family)
MYLVAGYKLKDIYIAKGRLSLGLIIGLLSFILMGFLALNNHEQHIDSVFLKRNILWILLFVFSNSFMEELLFRGIFLNQLNNLFKPYWSIILTAIVFAASHMQVTYTPDVFIFVGLVLILGLLWGFLMHFTKSIIVSMLFHAGADLMIIIPIYSTYGVTG